MRCLIEAALWHLKPVHSTLHKQRRICRAMWEPLSFYFEFVSAIISLLSLSNKLHYVLAACTVCPRMMAALIVQSNPSNYWTITYCLPIVSSRCLHRTSACVLLPWLSSLFVFRCEFVQIQLRFTSTVL